AGRARLDAQSATDAPQVVDLVDAPVPFAGRVPLFVGVVGALDVDRVGRARPRAQFTADALLESVRIPVELVASVVAGCGGSLLFRILLGVGLLEHRRERHTETGERAAE